MNLYVAELRLAELREQAARQRRVQAARPARKNPAGGHYEEQVGRRIGPDIVQVGARPNGTPTRWTFTEITPDSFRWRSEALEPDGKTWTPEGEFRARRRH